MKVDPVRSAGKLRRRRRRSSRDGFSPLRDPFLRTRRSASLPDLLFVIGHALRLPAPQTDSFDEKSLKKEKHCHHWQHNQTGSSHQQVELNSIHRFEKSQAQGQRV
jgi:hypothetical protein